MFNIGMMEFILLVVIAFVVVGPKDLPKVIRAVARSIKYIKKLSHDMIASLELEEELSAINEIKGVKKALEDEINPKQILKPFEKEFNEIQNEVKSAVQMGGQTKTADK